MSLNLPLPPLSPAADVGCPTPRTRRGQITRHPRYASWLRKAGLDSVDVILGLGGEIVGGHPDRHVVRVEVPTPAGNRVLFLKREHFVGWRVRWKNYRAGFGAVSRCEREAATLQALESCGLPGPQWLAYGTAPDGRAFLLLDGLAGMTELKTVLRKSRSSPSTRRRIAVGLGRAVADLHAAGFATPDLSSKHVFVDRTSTCVTLVDWQSAPLPGSVTLDRRIRAFAMLNASMSDSYATVRDRLRVVQAYVRSSPLAARPKTREFVRAVLRLSNRLVRSSSIRDQRNDTGTANDLRLVWLAGEAVCVVPSLAGQWPNPPAVRPFYPSPSDAVVGPDRQYIVLPDGRLSMLTRYSTVAPLGRMWARLRGRPWRSPAAAAARVLFQLQRSDAPAPRLLAFGQKFVSPLVAQSFVLTDQGSGAESLADRLARSFPGPLDRFLFLRQCGRAVRELHDAGGRFSRYRPDAEPLIVVPDDRDGGVRIHAPDAVERAKRMTDRDRFADVQRVLFAVYESTTKSERLRIVLGYLDETGGLPPRWRRAVARLIRD